MDSDAERLWQNAPRSAARFASRSVASLPEPARRYLVHTFPEGAPLSLGVRLRMHGTIRLGQKHHPFQGSQISVWPHGFRWDARVRMNGLAVSGFDRLVDGAAEMRWKMFGALPLVHANGADVTRSAWGRMIAEAVWLPAALMPPLVSWTTRGPNEALAEVALAGERATLSLSLHESGALRSLRMERWGNPDKRPFGYYAFGGYVEEERTLGGVTLPTRLRIGWFMGDERFEQDGEFFRVQLDDAEFAL